MSKPDEPVGPSAVVRDREQELARTFVMLADSLIVIEQAKGVLAERNGVSMVAAFDYLRRYARDQNVKLTDLAHAVVYDDFNPASAQGRPPV